MAVQLALVAAKPVSITRPTMKFQLVSVSPAATDCRVTMQILQHNVRSGTGVCPRARSSASSVPTARCLTNCTESATGITTWTVQQPLRSTTSITTCTRTRTDTPSKDHSIKYFVNFSLQDPKSSVEIVMLKTGTPSA